jgi:GNAT superfamily N-acetyltransferase
MNPVGAQVELSEIDEQRFGIRTARSTEVTCESLPGVLDYCRRHDVRLLIARCRVSELAAAQALEQAGGGLMDTLVYYARDLLSTPIPVDTDGVSIRGIRPGDEAPVQAIAVEAFRGYVGHYHADPRPDRAKCDEAYTSWAVRSCTSREVADEVLVADRDGELLGFATLRLNSRTQGECALFAVAPAAQGGGVGRSLMAGGMRWCAAQGAHRMIISTQLINLAVQKVWVRVGFEPDHAYYTFHVWLDAAPGNIR